MLGSIQPPLRWIISNCGRRRQGMLVQTLCERPRSEIARVVAGIRFFPALKNKIPGQPSIRLICGEVGASLGENSKPVTANI